MEKRGLICWELRSECMTQQGTEEFDHWHQMDSRLKNICNILEFSFAFQFSGVTFSTSFITYKQRDKQKSGEAKSTEQSIVAFGQIVILKVFWLRTPLS